MPGHFEAPRERWHNNPHADQFPSLHASTWLMHQALPCDPPLDVACMGLLPCLPHSYVAPAQMGCDSWQVLVGTRMQEGI